MDEITVAADEIERQLWFQEFKRGNTDTVRQALQPDSDPRDLVR